MLIKRRQHTIIAPNAPNVLIRSGKLQS